MSKHLKRTKISRTPLSWIELESMFPNIIENVPDKVFVGKLLNGSFSVAKDKTNAIRGNLLAGILREIITYSLHSLAPNSEVEKCPWYKLQNGTNGPTRPQRAQFISQAGISDCFVETQLKIDPKRVRKPISEIMDKLSKNVHVQPGKLLDSDLEIRSIATDCFLSLVELYDHAKSCRKSIEEAVLDSIDQALADKMIFDVIDNLDEISTHTSVEGHNLEEIAISSIGHEYLYFEASGTVDVELQYGSNSDVRNDLGHVTGDAYPYAAILKSKVSNPLHLLASETDINVDTSSFYE